MKDTCVRIFRPLVLLGTVTITGLVAGCGGAATPQNYEINNTPVYQAPATSTSATNAPGGTVEPTDSSSTSTSTQPATATPVEPPTSPIPYPTVTRLVTTTDKSKYHENETATSTHHLSDTAGNPISGAAVDVFMGHDQNPNGSKVGSYMTDNQGNVQHKYVMVNTRDNVFFFAVFNGNAVFIGSRSIAVRAGRY